MVVLAETQATTPMDGNAYSFEGGCPPRTVPQVKLHPQHQSGQAPTSFTYRTDPLAAPAQDRLAALHPDGAGLAVSAAAVWTVVGEPGTSE
jgi:hypothetical protein